LKRGATLVDESMIVSEESDEYLSSNDSESLSERNPISPNKHKK